MAVLAELGGVAHYADLAPIGQRAVAAACRDGVMIKTNRGQYVNAGLAEHRQATLKVGGTLSHLSAAAEHGWLLEKMPDRPHVTVPPNRHPSASAATSLRVYYRKLRLDEIVDGVTEPLRTLVDCARDLPFDVALTVADSALRVGAVRSDELCTLASELQGRGAVQARAVLAAADGQGGNPLESVLRARCL